MDDLYTELMRVNALLHEYADERNTLDGFEEWLLERDRSEAAERSAAA